MSGLPTQDQPGGLFTPGAFEIEQTGRFNTIVAIVDQLIRSIYPDPEVANILTGIRNVLVQAPPIHPSVRVSKSRGVLMVDLGTGLVIGRRSRASALRSLQARHHHHVKTIREKVIISDGTKVHVTP